MDKRKPQTNTKRMVWRMDAEHPQGAWVDPTAPKRRSTPRREPGESGESGWLDSGLALRDGLQVEETPMDSLPGELGEELLRGGNKGA